MSKHTPGNWIAKPIDSADWIDLVTDDPETCGGLAHSLPFASCRHFNQEANARLIAAAPELLEALEALLREVSKVRDARPGEADWTRLNQADEAAWAVISKAEGE